MRRAIHDGLITGNCHRYIASENVRLLIDCGLFLRLYLLTASCKDVPEALIDGDSEQSALDDMSDALGAALAGYSLAVRALPEPSKARTGEYLVPVNALVAAKLALRTAMQSQSITNVRLAERLGISESAVRRLVNPDHFSRLDGVVAALQILGRRLVIEDQVAA